MVGNIGRHGVLPQLKESAERRAQRMAALAAADGSCALANEADPAREAAVGLGDDPFLAPAEHIVGLPPPKRGLNPFAAPIQPLLAPGVNANAQQPDNACLSGGLPGGVALNPNSLRKVLLMLLLLVLARRSKPDLKLMQVEDKVTM